MVLHAHMHTHTHTHTHTPVIFLGLVPILCGSAKNEQHLKVG